MFQAPGGVFIIEEDDVCTSQARQNAAKLFAPCGQQREVHRQHVFTRITANHHGTQQWTPARGCSLMALAEYGGIPCSQRRLFTASA